MIGGFIGFVGIGWAVGFLAVATRSRMPHLRRFMIYAPIVGGVVLGVSTLASQIGQMQVISDVLDGPRTVAAVTDTSNSLIQVAQLLLLLGTFALAVGMVLVSLNAMRAGLLTRMLGYLGIAAGALMVIISGGMPIVQIFWLAALGFILLGRWPGGAPPAWRTGQAEPWPRPRRASAGPAARGRGPSLQKRRRPRAPVASERSATDSQPCGRQRRIETPGVLRLWGTGREEETQMATEGQTLEQQLEELLDQEKFPPPDGFAERAVVSDAGIYEQAEDYEAFWAERAGGAALGHQVGPGAGLVEPAVRQVVRRRQAQRLLQLPRPPRRGRQRRPRRLPLAR